MPHVVISASSPRNQVSRANSVPHQEHTRWTTVTGLALIPIRLRPMAARPGAQTIRSERRHPGARSPLGCSLDRAHGASPEPNLSGR